MMTILKYPKDWGRKLTPSVWGNGDRMAPSCPLQFLWEMTLKEWKALGEPTAKSSLMRESHSHWIKLLVSLWFCDSLNFLESKPAVGLNVHQHLFTDKRATSKHTNVSRKQIMWLFLLNEPIVLDSQVMWWMVLCGCSFEAAPGFVGYWRLYNLGGGLKKNKIRNTELVRKGMFFRIRKKTIHNILKAEKYFKSHIIQKTDKVLLTAWQTPIIHFFPLQFLAADALPAFSYDNNFVISFSSKRIENRKIIHADFLLVL